MTERDVQERVARHMYGKSHRLIVPNCRAFGPEADLLSVTTSDLVHEVEVKTDRSDFDREFRTKSFKHESLREGHKRRFRDSGPNYFWFAVPDGLVSAGDVPSYAGLMTVPLDGDACVVRGAPRLHGKHISDRARRYLERGVTVRYWDETTEL